jgi:glycosyltransferase involved in cell wall biosynthesis
MKWLLIHNLYREPGGENAVFRLLGNTLRAHGEEVVEYTRDNHELDELSLAGRARVFAEGFYSERTAREIAGLIHVARPRVALVQNVFPLISPAAYLVLQYMGLPTAQLVYNYRFICPNGHLYTQGAICERCVRSSFLNAVIHKCYRESRFYSAWYAGILGWYRARGTFASLDRFLVPDDFMRRKLIEGGLPATRARVVGNPFDLAGYEPSETEDNIILFIGRLIRQKGILTLVRAFAQARTAARLIVVGEGEVRAEAEQLAQTVAPGRVTFAGAVWGEALMSYLARCLYVCLPSEWYDNAPLVLYQAYATGKPVIAARINGLPEVIAEDEDGLLAAPGDIDEWTVQIEKLASDILLRRRLGRAARRKAEVHFTLPAYYRRLQAAVEDIIEKSL